MKFDVRKVRTPTMRDPLFALAADTNNTANAGETRHALAIALDVAVREVTHVLARSYARRSIITTGSGMCCLLFTIDTLG
jgi:hypothetical protein